MPSSLISPSIRQRGFSLIELLLVLGILAVFLIAAFVFYPSVRDRNQANSEAANLNGIKANLNTLYAIKGGNYRGLTIGVANQARAFPTTMNGGDFSANAPITSSWGGTVSLEVNTSATTTTQTPGGALPANRSFSVSYTDVPIGICLPLVTAAGVNFQGIRVGGTEIMTADGGGSSAGLDPAIAAAACAEGAQAVVFISS